MRNCIKTIHLIISGSRKRGDVVFSDVAPPGVRRFPRKCADRFSAWVCLCRAARQSGRNRVRWAVPRHRIAQDLLHPARRLVRTLRSKAQQRSEVRHGVLLEWWQNFSSVVIIETYLHWDSEAAITWENGSKLRSDLNRIHTQSLLRYIFSPWLYDQTKVQVWFHLYTSFSACFNPAPTNLSTHVYQ